MAFLRFKLFPNSGSLILNPIQREVCLEKQEILVEKQEDGQEEIRAMEIKKTPKEIKETIIQVQPGKKPTASQIIDHDFG